MALTTAFLGDRITDCSSVTNWDNTTITAVAVDTVTTVQNSNSIASQASNKDGYIHYDYSGTGSFDFSDDGTDWGKHIYIWINCTTPGIIGNAGTAGSKAQGMYILIGSDDTNFACYTVHGGDYLDRYNGGWKRFVIDPRKAPTSYIGTAASVNFASISRFGVGVETNDSARSDNLFIDAIDVGTGLRAYGTGTTDDSWSDILADDANTTTNVWGILQEVNGILYSLGALEIGDNVSTNATTFTDQNKIIQWSKPEYFDANGNWVSAVGDDLFELRIVGNATGSTSFTDGVIVGTDNGRNGCTYIGSSTAATKVDLYDGTNAANDVNLYGAVFKDMLAGISWGNDGDHLYYGGQVISCGQFDSVGAPVIRNCSFINTSHFPTDCAYAAQDDAASFTDYTAAANDTDNDGTGDVNFTPATPATNDAFYVGHKGQFDALSVMVTSAGSGTITWEYYNGSWVSLTGIADGTSSFSSVGVNPVTWTMPADWTATTVNSQGPYYYVRGRVSTAGTQAVGERVWVYSSAPDGSALLWNSNIDIQNCQFIAHTDPDNDPSAIEHNTNDADTGSVTTADATGVTLTDTSATFTTWGVTADDVVYNRTDGSWAKVVSVTSQTELITDGLTGGTDDEFAISDAYDIAYPITYTDLEFSGNDYDAYNSTTAAIAISKSGASNPADYDTDGEWMTFIGSVTVKVTVVDADNDPIETAQTAIYLASDKVTEIVNGDTNASGIVTTSYTGSTPVNVIIRIRKNSPTDDPRYVNKTVPAVIQSGTGLDTTIPLDIDTVAGTG